MGAGVPGTASLTAGDLRGDAQGCGALGDSGADAQTQAQKEEATLLTSHSC